jgi:hypothetical protein
VTQGSYQAQIDTVYGFSTTATGAQTIPASGGAGVTVSVTSAKEFADANVLGGGSLPQATFGGVAFTYTGKTATSLTGCVSTTGSTISVTNGGTVSSTYAQQSGGYNPWARASGFSVANGFTFPIRIVQATDDTTVPQAMNLDATNGFIARTGNANITSYGAITGGHSTAISNVSRTYVRAFFDGLSW